MGLKEKDRFRQVFERRLREASDGSFPAEIESVNEDERTCCVNFEGVIYEDVLLRAASDGNNEGMCVIPSQGSRVIVSRLGGSSMLYVSMFSRIDKLLLSIQGVDMVITQGGFTIRKNESGLKRTLTRLCEAIGRLTVTTNVGPSGIPINKAEFDEIRGDLNNYLEG